MHRLFIHKTDEGFQVSPIDADGRLGAPLSLSAWAQTMPDLTQVSMVLDAKHYVVRWVDMPGVKSRQLNKALPFALEESLIQEVDNYLILAKGQQGSKVRAYVIEEDFLDRLLQACKLENLQLTNLTPVTQLIQEPWVIQRFNQGWLFNFQGHFEAWVNEQSLPLVLESSLEHLKEKKLLVKAESLDAAQLMRSNIETGFGDAFDEIEVQVEDSNALFIQPANTNNLNFLVNRVKAETKKDAQPVWFKPLIALSAACVLIWFVHINIETYQLEQQSAQVRKQAEGLYKNLFPGERIRFLKRQFNSKLSAGGSVESADFIALVNKTAQVYAQNAGVSFSSLRFNERSQQLALDVSALSLENLQAFENALIKAGLTAKIGSATNDEGQIKGRMSISFGEAS